MISFKGFARLYRLSNNGKTNKSSYSQLDVNEVQVFSDQGCLNKITVTYVGESGHGGTAFDGRDGSKAFDKSDSTYWSPQCSRR